MVAGIATERPGFGTDLAGKPAGYTWSLSGTSRKENYDRMRGLCAPSSAGEDE